MAEDDKLHIHTDPAEQRIPENGPDECPECRVPAETGFGLAGGGYGIYSYCPKCGNILSEIQMEN